MSKPDYRNKLKYFENPKLEKKSENEIVMRTDNCYFRFLRTEGNLCVFGSFGCGVYLVGKDVTWEQWTNLGFDYFIEKCIASPYGNHWANGNQEYFEDVETHPHAWGQYTALHVLGENLFQLRKLQKAA